MALKIEYTARDFDSILLDLETKIVSEFGSTEEAYKSLVFQFLVRLMAMDSDKQAFYLNRLVNELFLPTVQRRRNAQKILNRLDYKLGGRVPASVDLTFTFQGGGSHAEDVTVPAGFQVQTAEGLIFETLSDLTITAGNPNGVVSAKHWLSQEQNFEFDGTANQEKTLSVENFIEVDTNGVVIDSQIWTEVDTFLDSGPTDKHYTLEIDEDVKAVLVFGDGVTGAMPNNDGDVDYKTGGGASGNDVGAGALVIIQDTVRDALNDIVIMEVTNASSPSGGEDEESIDNARVAAPKLRKTRDFTATREDYETNGEDVDGVVRILALGRRDNGAIPANTVYIYVVPNGGGAPSTQLKTDVETMLTVTKPAIGDPTLVIQDPVYVPIAITATVTEKDGYNHADVVTAVETAIQDYFEYDSLDDTNLYNINFGYYKDTFYLSNLFDIIMSTKIDGINCVKNTTITAPTGNTSIDQYKIPSLGTLTIT